MLEDLYAGSVADTHARLEKVSVSALEKLISKAEPAIDVFETFGRSQSIQVISEIKRASPSKGFLAAVRSAVAIPILRKDFIAMEEQVLEARAYGADLVLLIVAGLAQAQLKHLFNFVQSFGMTPFVETHNEDEIHRALEVEAKLIGVNARDLSTFETDRSLFASLVDLLPEGAIAVAESAVRDVSDVTEYARAGADMVLVGEALVTGDAKELLNQFTSVPKIRL